MSSCRRDCLGAGRVCLEGSRRLLVKEILQKLSRLTNAAEKGCCLYRMRYGARELFFVPRCFVRHLLGVWGLQLGQPLWHLVTLSRNRRDVSSSSGSVKPVEVVVNRESVNSDLPQWWENFPHYFEWG